MSDTSWFSDDGEDEEVQKPTIANIQSIYDYGYLYEDEVPGMLRLRTMFPGSSNDEIVEGLARWRIAPPTAKRSPTEIQAELDAVSEVRMAELREELATVRDDGREVWDFTKKWHRYIKDTFRSLRDLVRQDPSTYRGDRPGLSIMNARPVQDAIMKDEFRAVLTEGLNESDAETARGEFGYFLQRNPGLYEKDRASLRKWTRANFPKDFRNA